MNEEQGSVYVRAALEAFIAQVIAGATDLVIHCATQGLVLLVASPYTDKEIAANVLLAYETTGDDHKLFMDDPCELLCMPVDVFIEELNEPVHNDFVRGTVQKRNALIVAFTKDGTYRMAEFRLDVLRSRGTNRIARVNPS